MVTLTFTEAENGRYETIFTAGQVNILQLEFDIPVGMKSSLAVHTRLGSDMQWELAHLYLPCPSRVVSLPVQNGEEVKLVSDIVITKASLISEAAGGSGGTGGITPADIAQLAEQVEKNRLDIEAQKKLNETQQVQIDKNTEVNEAQEEKIIDGTDIASLEAVENLFK